jgi:hypothetical protein
VCFSNLGANHIQLFTAFLEKQTNITDGYKAARCVSQKLGINHRTYNDWRNGVINADNRGIARRTLDDFTQKFQLTPVQERELWSIAQGKPALGTVEQIVLESVAPDREPIKDISSRKQRDRRVSIWEKLQSRCGFSNAKLAEMTGYTAEGIRQLRMGKKQQFAKLVDAKRIAKAFIPDNIDAQNTLSFLLLGVPRHYNAEEFAQAIINETVERRYIFHLVRLQHKDEIPAASTKVGCQERTYASWETESYDMRNEAMAVGFIEYMGLPVDHPLYEKLLGKLCNNIAEYDYNIALLDHPDGLMRLRKSRRLNETGLGRELKVDRSSVHRFETNNFFPRSRLEDYMNALSIPDEDRP